MTALTGIGLYSPRQAAELTGIESRTLRRWLLRDNDTHEPLWHPEPEAKGAPDALSFRDLLEVKAVWALKQQGVSLQTIRRALDNLKSHYQVDYPLTNPHLATDGKNVFFSTIAESGEEWISDLAKRQKVFAEVMSPAILKSISFDERQNPVTWQPDPTDPLIQIDPRRGFGKPYVLPSYLSTYTLSRAYEAENENAETVARFFDVTEDEVIRAANFEKRIAAGAHLH
ncbi:hypothetical protein BTW08_12795 [Salinicola sp. MH3R3-1]|uniref:MerR family transcriptional regulator n=1 Tax=Salinicola sp. MH3R3-1 TaxID=1928762 RepID=UPI00094EC5DA|nr:MerR family transcriptional regulator [Salinicola sp. MH3R3-1]OLO07323.1 hypothetical protein BTW08_12795 [Salinicola sp. MH3R3-1]